MSFPAHVSCWSSQYANATLLGVLDCISFEYESTQFGGIGAGKFSFGYAPEDAAVGNLNAPNRIDCYVLADVLTAGVAASGTVLTVANGTRFKANQPIVIYDGINQDFMRVSASTATTVTLTNPISRAYSLGASVLVLRYRGRISSRQIYTSLDKHVDIETQGYVGELGDIIDSLTVNSSANKECGWLVYQILTKSASQLDLIINPSNFVMTTDPNGAVNGSGTNVAYASTSTNRSVISMLQDIIKTANGGNDTSIVNTGNPNNSQYTFWIDEQNYAHFGLLPTSPTITYSLQPGAVGVDGYADIVGDHVTHDQDTLGLINTYMMVGGQDPTTKQPVTAIVFDQTSVNQYGQREAVLTVPNITDVKTLTAYGQQKLNVSAFPQTLGKTSLVATGSFCTAQDFVKVQGFTDGSNQQFNVQSVRTTWSGDTVAVKQEITEAAILPDVNRTMREIAGQHFLANNGTITSSTRLDDRFVQSGILGSVTLANTTLSLTAGVIQAQVTVAGSSILTQFNTPAFTFTPGVNGTYTVAWYYRNADGTQATTPTWMTYAGTTPPAGYTGYNLIPMFVITRLGGLIVGANFVGNNGGIGQANLIAGSVGTPQLAANPNPTVPPALQAGTTPTLQYLTSGGGAYEVACTFTLAVPASAASYMSCIRVFTVPKDLAFAGNSTPQGDYPVYTYAAAETFQVVISGLSSGQQYDVYAAWVDIKSFVSTALKVATTAANPQTVQLSQLPAMPVGHQPIVTSAATLSYPNIGSATFDADASVTLNSEATNNTPWLAFLEAVAQPSTQTNSWTVYNIMVANANGVYVIPYGGLGAGQTWTLGIRYVDGKDGRSAVTVLGTTAANPIQSSAIATGAVGTQHLGSSVVDVNGQFLYPLAPGALKSVVTPGGGLVVNPPAGVTGTLPYNNSAGQFTTTIAASANPSSGSFLTSSSVSTSQVQSVSIISTQLAQNRYDTTIQNKAGNTTGQYQWYNTGSSAYLAANATLSNGASLLYDVKDGIDAGSANAAIDSYTLSAGSAATFVFKHNAFTTGSHGQPNIIFTGQSVSAGANVNNSIPISGNDQPTVTSSQTSSTTNNAFNASLGSFASSPTISQNVGTGYTTTQHNSGAVSGTGSVAGTTSTTSTSTVNTTISSAAAGSSLVTPLCRTTARMVGPTGDQTMVYTDSGGGTSATQSWTASVTTPVSATYPVTLNISSITYTYNTSLATCQMNITVLDGAGISVLSSAATTGATFSQTFTSGNVGTWTVQLSATSVADGSSNNTTGSTTPTVAYSGAFGGYQTANSGVSTTPGSYVLVYQTPATSLAPTSAGTQLSFTITGTTGSGGGNVSSPHVIVQRATDNATVLDCGIVTSTTTFNYSNGSAPAGTYNVYYRAEMTTAAAGGYNIGASVSVTSYYYTSDPYSTTSYVTANGASTTYTTDPATVAPTTVGTQLQLVISSLALPSNSAGSSGLTATLYDANNNNLYSTAVTATGTFTYHNVAAVAGQYHWVLTGTIATNTSTAAATYAVTAAGSIGWYQAVTSTTTTYYNNSGQAYYYSTPTNTIAPTASGSQISLDLTSVTTPADSKGTTYLYVQLKNPAGTVVTTNYNAHYNSTTGTDTGAQFGYTGATTFTYFNGAAASGVYTWIVYAQVVGTSTGNSQYSDSWSGTQSYYLPGASGGNTYILGIDGITQRLASNDSDVDFLKILPDQLSFQVFNNAASAVGFSIGIDVRGL